MSDDEGEGSTTAVQPADGTWEEYMDKDVMVRTLLPGEGPMAEFGSVVHCSLRCHTVKPETTDILELVESGTGYSFKVGEGDCVPGLELALRHSRRGGRLLVRCTSKYAYGP
eukprot:RCo053661